MSLQSLNEHIFSKQQQKKLHAFLKHFEWFVICFSVQGMKLRSNLPSFRPLAKTLVFTDAQSQMSMAQTQQTVSSVRTVCTHLPFI